MEGYTGHWLSGDTEGYSGVGMYYKTKPIKITEGIGQFVFLIGRSQAKLLRMFPSFSLSSVPYSKFMNPNEHKVLIRIFTFLWKKKYSNQKAFEKIKRNNLCKDAADGGPSEISVKDQQNTFLLRWLDEACKDVLEGNTQGKVIDSLCRSLGSFTYLTEATVKAKEVKEIQLVK